MHTIDALMLRRLLSAPGEIALLDVREAGQYGLGHISLAANMPYSELELQRTTAGAATGDADRARR